MASVEAAMSQRTIRRIAVLEPVSIFALIMAYIWVLRFGHRWAWVGILGLMLASHKLRREDAGSLGFRWANLRQCLFEVGPALAFVALLLFAAGMVFDTTRQVHMDQAFLSWAAYLPWGIFQQYILNGYFLTRFDAAVSRRAASAITAAFFAGAHTPNWFLMAVTLLLGYCCTILYRRYKNLYFLGIAHGTVGFLLYLVVPDSISHHLNVGPGWFR